MKVKAPELADCKSVWRGMGNAEGPRGLRRVYAESDDSWELREGQMELVKISRVADGEDQSRGFGGGPPEGGVVVWRTWSGWERLRSSAAIQTAMHEHGHWQGRSHPDARVSGSLPAGGMPRLRRLHATIQACAGSRPRRVRERACSLLQNSAAPPLTRRCFCPTLALSP
eukprot:6202686-Pleurochrysis_carterae.AAC.2